MSFKQTYKSWALRHDKKPGAWEIARLYKQLIKLWSIWFLCYFGDEYTLFWGCYKISLKRDFYLLKSVIPLCPLVSHGCPGPPWKSSLSIVIFVWWVSTFKAFLWDGNEFQVDAQWMLSVSPVLFLFAFVFFGGGVEDTRFMLTIPRKLEGHKIHVNYFLQIHPMWVSLTAQMQSKMYRLPKMSPSHICGG